MKFAVSLFSLIAICNIVFPQEVVKIAFGSCSHQNDSLFILNDIAAQKADFFVFLGDNIYADTKNADTLKAKYDLLGKKTAFKNLKAEIKIIATWDDHDYGMDDVGKYYELKKESKQQFLQFFEEPKLTMRRFREGIYTSYIYYYTQKDNSVKKLQFIVLDERTFRSDLRKYERKTDTIYKNDPAFFYHMDYLPHESSDSTILGQEQWLWLEEELKKEADFRIICSGTQFGISYNSYESWANFPSEQEKMLELIRKTRAENLVFISGDVHYAEISKLTPSNLYPIYDITSSGLSEKVNFATSNTNRIEGPIMDNNYGLLTVDWKNEQIKMEIWDEFQNQRVEYSISLTDLKFK
jgi:alkaline phosphatase D